MYKSKSTTPNFQTWTSDENEWLHRVLPKAYSELAFGFAGAPDMPEVQRFSRTLSLTSGDDAAAAKAGPTMQITKKTRARGGDRFLWLRAHLAQGRQS